MRILWIFLLTWLYLTPVFAQAPSPTPTPVQAVAIPLGDISSTAESVATKLATLQAELRDDNLLWTIRQGLPPLTQEIDVRRSEDARLLQNRPDLETLRSLEKNWRVLGQQLPEWKQALEARVTRLDEESAELAQSAAAWQLTLNEAGRAGLPGDLLATAQTTMVNLQNTRQDMHKRRGELVALQNAVAKQAARVKEAAELLTAARTQSVSHILVQDSPPMWSAETRLRLRTGLVYDVVSSVSAQVEALGAYLERQSGKLMGPLFLLLLCYLLLSRARKWVRPEQEPALVVLHSPLATAMLLSVLTLRGLDPSAPRLLLAGLGAITLVPSVLLLRRLTEPRLWPILNALVVFFFVDQLRLIAATIPLLARLLLLAEAVGGLLFLVWFSRVGHLKVRQVLATEGSVRFDLVIYFVTLGFLTSALANLLGFMGLARLIANGLLGSAYLGAILYGVLKMLEGLLALSLELRPISLLRMVRNHRALLLRRTLRGLRLAAGLLWTLAVLELLAVREPVMAGLRNFFTSSWGVGTFQVSPGRLLAFGLIVWLALGLSRLARFALSEDVFPRVKLGRGVPYAVSNAVHYAVLFVGAMVALSALGVDTTRLTVVAGALSVGIGFGLQNIVNNFVSGLILLVERPVNVGDTVKLGEFQGELRRIGLRSSLLVIGDGSQVIVPNSELINQKVVNWTRAGNSRRAELKFGIGLEDPVDKALEAMETVANRHPHVMKQPPPQALLLGFNGRAVDLQLLVWVDDYRKLAGVRSELGVTIVQALRDGGIHLTSPT